MRELEWRSVRAGAAPGVVNQCVPPEQVVKA